MKSFLHHGPYFEEKDLLGIKELIEKGEAPKGIIGIEQKLADLVIKISKEVANKEEIQEWIIETLKKINNKTSEEIVECIQFGHRDVFDGPLFISFEQSEK